MKNRSVIIIIAISVGVLLAVSCGRKSIDKSLYKPIDIREAGLGTIIGASEPDANTTVCYSAGAKYLVIPDDVKKAFKVGRGQVAFADPASEGYSWFYLNGSMPDLKEGQAVTLYFRIIRRDGRVERAEIDLIE